MKTFRVSVDVVATFEYEVEADSKKDAMADALAQAEDGVSPDGGFVAHAVSNAKIVEVVE